MAEERFEVSYREPGVEKEIPGVSGKTIESAWARPVLLAGGIGSPGAVSGVAGDQPRRATEGNLRRMGCN